MKKEDFQNRFDILEEKCLKNARLLKNSLFAGSQFQLPKDEIMYLNREILDLSSEWSITFPKTANTQIKDERNLGIEEKLINLYKQCINEFVKEMQEELKKTQNQKETTLQLVAKHYHNYKAFSFWLFKIFYHLDSSTLTSSGADLHSLSLKTLKDVYFKEAQEKLLRTILDVLLESRQKQLLLDKKIKSLCELFVVMGANTVKLKYEKEQGMYDYICQNFSETEKFYKETFEERFLDETQKFYKRQITERKNLGVIEFVRWALKVISMEEQMCLESYSKSLDQIKRIFNQLFVIEQAERLSARGVQYLLSVGEVAKLGELYNLISRQSECVKFIAQECQIYYLISARSADSIIYDATKQQQVVNKQTIAEQYCNKMLELMETTLQTIKNYMQNDNKLIQAYEIAFTTAFNENSGKPLYLAIFADLQIRSEKGVNEIETDKKLNKIFSLFQLLYSRDNFLQHHQKFLSSRLLNQQTQNINLEKNLLQKFKGETQTNVLTQLQTMVNDIQQSQRFITDQSIDKNQKFNLTVYLLSQGCWPIDNIQQQIIPPQQMLSSLSLYEKIYKEKNGGRILQWTYNLGQGELNYKIYNDKYYFNVTTFQMIAFLLFNREDQLTIQQIQVRTQINTFDLENSLIPFVCQKILQRQKEELDEFSDKNEVITLNLAFNNKSKKLRMLPNAKMQPKRQRKAGELTQEEKEQEEQLIKQREFVVDSQLVRTMKCKKSITHSELIAQCTQMITIFKPDTKFIKKRIENLIDREYIKRDERNCNLYHYLN